MMTLVTDGSFMAKELEAEDIELKEYSFTPKEIRFNGITVLDYTEVENDKVFLCNKKDILEKPRPSWIPELDSKGLAIDKFLPICVKDFSDGNYFVQSKIYTGEKDSNGKSIYKNQIYKMSPDVLAATVDYYLKRKRAELKTEGSSEKVSLPRGMNSMPTSRYNEISKLCLLCDVPSLKYKNVDKSITDKAFEMKGKSPGKLYQIQNNVVFLEQWQPLLENIKGKRLDMNYQKQDYIDSYSKAVETAYGDSKTFNNLYNDFGIKIKKQNGTNFSKPEIEKLSETLKKVYAHYGNLSELAGEYGLKISYADNCMQFARKAIGLYFSYYNAIGISFFNEEKQLSVAGINHLPDVTLAHEIAHWLDSQKGKESHNFFASDKYGTLENQIATKFKEEIKLREKSNKSATRIGKADEIHLGEYWHRTCECFARAMEQYYALKQGIDLSEEIAYARKDNFEEDFIPLIEELMEKNKRHFGINDASHGISNSSVSGLQNTKVKGEYLLAAEEEFLRREEPYKVVDAYSISTKSIYDNVIKRLDSEGYVCRTQLKLSEYRTPSFSELDEYIKENSKKYQPVIVLFDEYNDYDKTTNEYKTIKAWQIYDKESLENGTYISLGKCKINYLNENLELEYKGPFVAPGSQITARSYYNSKGTRELCHIIKEANRNSEEYKNAIEKAASYIAEHIHKSRHTYLVPAPNHNGKAEYTYDIARIVGLKINAPVFNILECKPHETLYEQKKKNLEPEVELFLNDYGKSVISNFPEGRNYIYLIDNCISTGLTFNKAAELINGLIPAVYAIGNFAEVKYVNEKYKVNNLLELKNEITHEENKLMENQEISKYSFIVKDNSEYGSDFEPVKNLSATEAVRLFQKLNESDISENRFGIALHIPGDKVFGEWAEEGISIVTLDDTEKANFSIYGDTFITQLNESDDRSRTYIDAYKDLYDAFEQSSKENSENYGVVYPDFLFEKEKELFSEHSVNENKTIGIKPVTLEEILDVMDMRPDYTQNGNFMIYDTQRQEYISSWVGWEDDNGAAVFKDASEAFERLDIYINDYYIHDMQEQLEAVGVEISGNETLSDLCSLYKAELEKGNTKLSEGELNLAMGIVEPDTVTYEHKLMKEKPLEKDETNELRPTFTLFASASEERITELKEHFSQNGYDVKWIQIEDSSVPRFTCDIDSKAYIQTILEERGIDYNYKLGLLASGYDASWLTEDEQLDAEVVTEEEFKRINEIREKEFKDLKLPYIKIDFTEGTTSSHKPAMMESGTVLGLKEGEELLNELNRRFNTFLKCDVSVNFPDAKDNEPGSYSLRYDFHDDKRTLENGKEVPFEREGLSDYIRMTCSYPEVLEKYEQQWQKVNASNITEEQKKLVANIVEPNYEKLKEAYIQHCKTLKPILEGDKKVHSSWIINKDVSDVSKSSVEKEKESIAVSFERYAGICINHIADYLNENKNLSFKDEFISYAGHQISNMLQDVKYGESRNAKFGEHGYDFDFSLWRKSLENVMDASEYDSFLTERLQAEELRYKEIRNTAKLPETNIAKDESFSLSNEEWRACDELAEKAKMDWWFEEYGSDGDIHKNVTKQDLEDLSTGFDGYLTIDEKYQQPIMELFKRANIEYNDITLLTTLNEHTGVAKNQSVNLSDLPAEELRESPITPEKSGTIEEYLSRLESLGAVSEEEAIEKQAELIDSREEVKNNKKIDDNLKTVNKAPDSVLDKKDKILPFSIIDNREKGRVNIKFDTVENNPVFNNILKELKLNGWKFAPSTKQWYPVGNAVKSASDFANRLQEKYTEIRNLNMEKPMDLGPEKSPYDGIRFFDRNYNESEDFAKFFNSNIHLFKKGKESAITEEDAATILKAIGYEKDGIVEQRKLRVGLDNKDKIVILTSENGNVKTEKIELSDILEFAKNKAEERVIESKQMLQNYLGKEPVVKKDLQDIFISLYETCVTQSEEIDSKMKNLYDSFIGKKHEQVKEAVLYQRTSYRGWEISADKDFKKSVYFRPFEQTDRSGYILMSGKEIKDGFWQEKFVREMLKSNNWDEKSAQIETLATLASDKETCTSLGIKESQSLNGFFSSLDKIIHVENDTDIKNELMESLLGPSEAHKVSKESTKELSVGDKLGEDTVSDLFWISDFVCQVTLSREVNGVGSAQNYFVIDNSIIKQLDEELKELVVSFDSKSVIENKSYEPYILKELIEKGLMPPRDDDFIQQLDEYISVHPLKYEKLKPVDYLNFERKLLEIAEVDKPFNKTPFELGQQLIALVDESDRERLNIWLRKQGCDSREHMAEVFDSWLNKQEQKKDITQKKNNGYPPRGEQ